MTISRRIRRHDGRDLIVRRSGKCRFRAVTPSASPDRHVLSCRVASVCGWVCYGLAAAAMR